MAAAEEVTRLRTQIAEMSAQQRDWDDAWRNGKEALMRVHAQELQNQREAALEEAERHVERELRELRDKCGDLSRDKMLLEEEVSKMRRTSEQLEVVHSALADARAELRNREGEASLRAMEFGEMEAEMLRERERREKLEKKLKKNGGGISAEEAGRLAAEAAAREVGHIYVLCATLFSPTSIGVSLSAHFSPRGLVHSVFRAFGLKSHSANSMRIQAVHRPNAQTQLFPNQPTPSDKNIRCSYTENARPGRRELNVLVTYDFCREDPRREEALAHEAGERTKLEGVVKALREKMKNVLSDEKLREALEALRRREKETTAECERLRKELAALRAAAAAASSATANGTKDETAALAPPQQDHVNFGAYVQKRREGKHREAKNMAKRAAAQTKRYFGINNDNNNGVGGGVVGGVGGKFGGVCTGVRSKSPSTAPVPLARKTVMGGGMTMNGAGGAGGGVGRENGGVGAGLGSTTALPPVTMTENSGVSIGGDVVGAGGGHTASTTIRHGRRRGGVQ